MNKAVKVNASVFRNAVQEIVRSEKCTETVALLMIAKEGNCSRQAVIKWMNGGKAVLSRFKAVAAFLNRDVSELIEERFDKGSHENATRIPDARAVGQCFQEFVYRVKANQSIHDIPMHRGDQGQEIRLEPGQQLEFVSSEVHDWTMDPLDNIEEYLKEITFTFPWGMATHRRLSESEVEAAAGELTDALLYAVRHVVDSYGMPALSAASKNTDPAQVLRDAVPVLKAAGRRLPDYATEMPRYVYEMISKLRGQLNAKPLPITLRTEPEQRRRVGIGFWRRAYAMYALKPDRTDDRTWMQFGPYIGSNGGCRGSRGAPKPVSKFSPSSKSAHPLPTAPTGCLLAVVGEFNADGSWNTIKLLPFGWAGSKVENTFNRTVSVFFRINDERPGDNGDGRCDVRFRRRPMEPPDSLTP